MDYAGRSCGCDLMVNSQLQRIGVLEVPSGSANWTPLHLSVGAGLKFWVSFADLSTLFQEAAGTTPVTANNDPIGLAQDKSGNGNDVKILGGWIANDRPLYKTDGSLHWADYAQRSISAGSRLSSASLASHLFSATGGWVAVAYEMRNAESLFALLGEQVNGTNFRQIQVWTDTRATPNRFAALDVSGTTNYINYPAEQAADVRTAIMNNESGTLKGYKDGSVLASTISAGELTGTTRLDLGWREGLHGTQNLEGKIFEACAGDGTLTADDITNLTNFLKTRAGI